MERPWCTIEEFLSAILAAFRGVPSHKWLRFGRSRSPLGCSIRYELGSSHFSTTIAVVHMLFDSWNMTCYPTISGGVSFVWEPWASFLIFCLSSSLSMIAPWTSCPFVMLTGALLLAFLLFKSSIGLGKMLLRGVVCRHNRANVWIWFRFCALIENVLNSCYDSFHQTIAPWVPWTLCHMVNCIFY